MKRFFAPGWRTALLALVAFLVLPDFPSALRSFLPVTETWILFTAAFAICVALGWWNGGGLWMAAVAIVLAWFAATAQAGPGPGTYRTLVHAWSLLLIAGFGVASLLTPGQRFFLRAIGAVGIAAAVAFAVTVSTPNGVSTVRAAMKGEMGRRTEATISVVNEMAATPVWRNAAQRNPGLDSMVASNEADLRSIAGRSVNTAPALLALESLIALTLAWVMFHRLSGATLGPALGAVREFRFNDQLIWGLAVGATIFFLPVFADGRDAGLNLLVFFGALYLLRGIGVLSFMTRSRWAGTLLIVVTIFAPLLLGAVALGIGVGDTWMDWRARAQAKA